MEIIDFIFLLAVLLMSVVIHEVAHGYAALFLGDKTAFYQKRLTLNPIRHIDPIGTIAVPALSIFLGGFVFGWAKPVPYNPYNLRNQKWGEALVASAGPLANVLLAVVFGLFIRFFVGVSWLTDPAIQIITAIVFINIILAFFNLLPVPPLDGSKILMSIVPYNFRHILNKMETYGLVVLIIALMLFGHYIGGIVSVIFKLLTGLSM